MPLRYGLEAHIEENSTDHLCFIKKKWFYQVDLEKFEI